MLMFFLLLCSGMIVVAMMSSTHVIRVYIFTAVYAFVYICVLTAVRIVVVALSFVPVCSTRRVYCCRTEQVRLNLA